MPNFILHVTDTSFKMPADEDIECFLLEASLPEEFIVDFAAAARQEDKTVLLTGENAAPLSARLKLDGVLIDLSRSEDPIKDFKLLRKQCAKNAVVGVVSRSRRHEAMLLSECEPDFVAFKAWSAGEAGTKELVAWYNELFLIRSAVFCQDDDVDVPGYETDIMIIGENLYKIFVAKKAKKD